LDTIIHSLDDQRDKMDEIDLNFVRTRKIDYLDTYEKLDRKYKLEKSSQYPLLNRLQKYKQILFEQEQEKCDYEYRYEFLENYCEKLQQEIQSIQSETKFIFNENLRIKTRITGVKNVPTITDYAHIIDQTKKLQHEIHIWTQRVAIAQVSYSFFL
jgi:predicted ribosome quality control (RQC) complex YloA/Tae2 family protein